MEYSLLYLGGEFLPVTHVLCRKWAQVGSRGNKGKQQKQMVAEVIEMQYSSKISWNAIE